MRKLIKEARESCKARGHEMSRFEHQKDIYGHIVFAYSSCKKCDKGVSIRVRPLPNEIQIGGEAVALCCIDPSS